VTETVLSSALKSQLRINFQYLDVVQDVPDAISFKRDLTTEHGIIIRVQAHAASMHPVEDDGDGDTYIAIGKEFVRVSV
jgi:hypothetical protein